MICARSGWDPDVPCGGEIVQATVVYAGTLWAYDVCRRCGLRSNIGECQANVGPTPPGAGFGSNIEIPLFPRSQP